MRIFNKKPAFTLPEVMITLTLIGTLATLTISTVGASIQQRARLAEFRTVYSKMETAMKNIFLDKSIIYSCYLKPTDDEIDEFGLRIEGDAVANSSNAGCEQLERDFVRAMGAVRFCDTADPYNGGCIPEKYPVAKAGCFQDYTDSHAFVLDNSMILITDNAQNGLKLFAIDINGRKGPNKWGQDIFPFSVKYVETSAVRNTTYVKRLGILPPNEDACTYADHTSSRTTTQMLRQSGNKL